MNGYDDYRNLFTEQNALQRPKVQRKLNLIKDSIKDKKEYEVIASKKPTVLVEDDENNIEKMNTTEEELTLMQKAKKAAVAVSGTGMIIVGIPLVPFPVPLGCPMIAGGFAVLASEFPAAQRVIDSGKNKLREFAEHKADDDNEEINEDNLGLGFEIVDTDDEKKKVSIEGLGDTNGDISTCNIIRSNKKKTKGPKESLRHLTKHAILPLFDRMEKKEKEEEGKVEQAATADATEEKEEQQQLQEVKDDKSTQ